MIGEDSNRVHSASEILPPFGQGMYDGEKLAVVDVVVSFSRREGFREVCAGMEVSIQVLLHEYPSGGSKGGVGHDEKGFSMVGEGEYWLFEKGVFDFSKGNFVVH